jgi:hypothetical protein
MPKEYIVYARKENEPEYLMQVVLETKDINKVNAYKLYAKDNGYILRIVEFTMSKPDFIASINI